MPTLSGEVQVTTDGVSMGLQRVPATEDEVTQRLGTLPEEQLLLCGHTHLQRSMRLTNGTLIVNPGSVGWPAYDDDQPYPHVIEAGTPHARYAVVDDTTGAWDVTFHRAHYDIEAAAAAAQANDRPGVKHALRTGRMH